MVTLNLKDGNPELKIVNLTDDWYPDCSVNDIQEVCSFIIQVCRGVFSQIEKEIINTNKRLKKEENKYGKQGISGT